MWQRAEPMRQSYVRAGRTVRVTDRTAPHSLSGSVASR
ncbi:MAG: hypothetical protein AVDCRST_MAG33-1471 [uncultured Thermomicrobiales bacterium]|uniref:Uncharacterized protein n=1 Tax=uncultured Thermomicrobiales bacterium TaxID=1645740 RepID=A0A6J4UWA5_9BACT|nr:MAG: hypothetical protein AVDCRST_MAG33-1471 [uncultured Thermomicrobiales bacterium]